MSGAPSEDHINTTMIKSVTDYDVMANLISNSTLIRTSGFKPEIYGWISMMISPYHGLEESIRNNISSWRISSISDSDSGEGSVEKYRALALGDFSSISDCL